MERIRSNRPLTPSTSLPLEEQVNSRKTEKTAGLSAHPEEAVSLSNRQLEGPRTGITPLTGLRIPAELNAKLDAWIERQPDPKPSRSEAIRRLLERALD